MLFSSPEFFIFFGAYLLLHALLPLRHRLPLIIGGSLVFYGFWNPWYAWIPPAFVVLAHYGGAWMMAAPEGRRRARLAGLIALLLVPLAVVKYSGFLHNELVAAPLGLPPWTAPWALPLGISFITFTLIAYAVDVHAGRYPLERNPSMLAGLVLFFPHLIAGPILRPAELLPQLHHQQPASLEPALPGIALFTLGLVKKLVFADSMAESVERAFAPGAGAGLSALDYWLAIHAFALQIYCDFSGYTDMAIGAALVLGVKLPANFERPYCASSVVDFWRRWHITLSRWLRDYLYIPLGGNRLGEGRRMANVLVTMGLGGLWHGANWTFILWGIGHGAGIVAVHALRGARLARIPRWLATVLTFYFVAFLWILFRAPDLGVARRVAAGAFTAPLAGVEGFLAANAFALALLAAFFILHRWDHHEAVHVALRRLPRAVLVPALALGWVLAIAVSHGSSAKFIYFDF